MHLVCQWQAAKKAPNHSQAQPLSDGCSDPKVANALSRAMSIILGQVLLNIMHTLNSLWEHLMAVDWQQTPTQYNTALYRSKCINCGSHCSACSKSLLLSRSTQPLSKNSPNSNQKCTATSNSQLMLRLKSVTKLALLYPLPSQWSIGTSSRG